MYTFIIDILPLSLFAILLYKSRIQKPFTALNERYLSIESTRCYRGFFAIAIVLHHIAQRSTGGVISSFFATLGGTFPTAIFFFLSGYGLQKSYISKQESYRKYFLRKRLSAILIPYIIIIIIYWIIYSIADGSCLSIFHIFIETLKGHPLITFSWYIIAILIFYIAYWLIMIICKKNYFWMIIAGTIWWLLYVLICKKLQYDNWWYISAHLLIVGMAWATYEKNILGIIEKRYLLIAPIIWLSTFLLIFSPQILPLTSIPFIEKNLIYLTTILFVLSVVLFDMKVQIENNILHFLGEISLEIYLMQELFLELLPKQLFPNNSEFLWALAVLMATICSAYFLHILFRLLLKKYRSAVVKSD